MSEPTPFEIAHRRLRLIGVALERLPGEYRVKPAAAKEAAWEAFEVLEEAAARGERMAAEAPATPPGQVKRRRRGKAVYRSPKAYLKALRKRHNRRLWAGRGMI